MSNSLAPFLQLSKLSFGYGERLLFNQLDFSMEKGETVSIIGPSGMGKTTLFRLVSGLASPTSGEILHQGKKTVNASFVTYMTQEDLLLPWRTVEDNISLLCELKGEAPGALLDIILSEVGLASFRKFYPKQLSGGMRQRVSLGRALLQKRPLLLLDEPFSSLDFETKEQLFELIKTVRESHALSLLLITHDFRDALALSDRIVLLSEGRFSREWKVTANEKMTPSRIGEFQQDLYDAMKESKRHEKK